MSDRFRQDVTVRFPPVDPWKVAADALVMIEGAFGRLWRDVEVELVSTSVSRITFKEPDLPALRDRVARHGGLVRDIVLDASYWDGSQHLTCVAYIWPDKESVPQLAGAVTFNLSGPNRVDVEAFAHSLDRSVYGMRRKKAWQDAKVSRSTMTVSSRADGQTTAREPIIRARGVQPAFWRWFVRKREEIIIGLIVGLATSLAFNALQITGVVPTPN